jgi:hypothetical protein
MRRLLSLAPVPFTASLLLVIGGTWPASTLAQATQGAPASQLPLPSPATPASTEPASAPARRGAEKDSPPPYGGLLSLTALGAIVGATMALLGIVIKELVIVPWFELWKAKRETEARFRKYRDPILLSAVELASRLGELSDEYPTDYLGKKVLAQATSPNQDLTQERDAYFCKYKAQGTIYRVAAFLGWRELYRQDVVFLDAGQDQVNTELQGHFKCIMSILADGHLIKEFPGSKEWADALIFREEQRAIGETMITIVNDSRTVSGYSSFISKLENGDRWLEVVASFVLDARSSNDLRPYRYKLLVCALAALIETLGGKVSDVTASRVPKYTDEMVHPVWIQRLPPWMVDRLRLQRRDTTDHGSSVTFSTNVERLANTHTKPTDAQA